MKRRSIWMLFAIPLASLALLGCSISTPLAASATGAAAVAATAASPTMTPAPTVSSSTHLLAPTTVPSATTPADTGALAALEGTLEQIYTQVNPAVVNIACRPAHLSNTWQPGCGRK